jgi:hypothetical protein
LLVAGSVVAVGAALIATANVASPASTQVLLVAAAVIAIAVTAGAKGRG